jgi:GcrA cell cycle regulator
MRPTIAATSPLFGRPQNETNNGGGNAVSFPASWTDERVEILKRLWADGLSASQIAAEIGGITRNAVIGKVHRLGLSGRAKSPPPTQRTRRPRQPRVTTIRTRGNLALAQLFEAEPDPVVDTSEHDKIIPIGQRCSVLELNENTCRWPIGDPQSFSNFYFCGGPPIAGHPYCGYHSRVAYQPPPPRRDRRPARS